jgi:hypothetical protein
MMTSVSRLSHAVPLLVLLTLGCGSASHVASGTADDARAPPPLADASVSRDGSPGTGADSSTPGTLDGSPPVPTDCITPAQLQTWQAQIDGFDGGDRPTGSPAHEGYIALLVKQLAAVGVGRVHTEPYAFTKWTPSSWSMAVTTGPATGPVTASAYVPYSGTTGPLGVEAPLAYVPGSTIPVDPTALAGALANPAAWTLSLTKGIEASLAATAGTLVGRIAVFELPMLALTLQTLTGTTLAVNDPAHTLSMTATLTRADLSAMLVVPAMLNALAAAGAVGAVGVLDVPEEAARGEYAPFFGVLSPNLPALYVDRTTGAALRTAITGGALPPAGKLVLDATVAAATSENVLGLLEGASTEQIVVGSHTDGPNSIEDNGPAAILGLASCLAQLPASARPRSVRFVLSGGHFAGSRGLQTYVAEHTADLTSNALAVMELEHLGAREWAEVSPGVMGLTGEPEVQVVYTNTNAPLVAASEAFAVQFPRTVVGTPPMLGEGQNFRILPLVQYITMPRYLLLGGLPVTAQFTDFDLMRQQVLAFVKMEQALAVAPASQLGAL